MEKTNLTTNTRVQQIRTEAKKRYTLSHEKGKQDAFTEGGIYATNAILEEVMLLLQVKFGYDDIYFKEAKKILSDMTIDE